MKMSLFNRRKVFRVSILLSALAFAALATSLMDSFPNMLTIALWATFIVAVVFLSLNNLRQNTTLKALRNRVSQLETSLDECTLNFDFALDSGAVGMYQWNLKTGKLTWSKHHFLIFGFAPNEIEPTYDLFRAHVHPDDIRALEHKLEQAKHSHQDYTNEFRLVLRNGEIRYIRGRGRWIHDEAGNVKTMVGIIIDDTQTRQKQLALDENRRQLKTLVENLPHVIARMDVSLRHLYVNNCIQNITGLKPECFIGKTNEQLGMDPKLCDLWRKESLMVINTRQPRKISFPFKSADNVTHYFEANIVPELDHQNDVASLLFITHDITELVNSQQALERKELDERQANLRKNDFLSGLAHELRNIITPLSNSIELLQLKSGGKPEDQHINRIMQRQVHILARLTNDLLDSSRIAKGKIELVKSYESLRSILETAVNLASPEMNARKHRLQFQLPQSSIQIYCDSMRLTQVFTNILNNAAKYTPDQGHIELFSELRENCVAVTVKDNGIGISPDKTEAIFEMFEQGGRQQKHQFSGMGVGLTVVKTLVEQHDGHVEVKSDGPDKGSLFRVTLPLQQSRALH